MNILYVALGLSPLGMRGLIRYCIELVISSPVALTFGAAEADAFVRSCGSIEVFLYPFRDVAPDVLHVHGFIEHLYRVFRGDLNCGKPMV